MKLAVLGGPGFITPHFLSQALRSGYAIKLLAPHASKSFKHPRLTIAHGSLKDISLIEEVLRDTQAVIALPQAIDNLETLVTIVQTMYAHNITRLIIAADLSQPESKQFEPGLKKLNIDWTVVRYTGSEVSFKVPGAAFAKYLMSQITDASNVRSAVLLSN